MNIVQPRLKTFSVRVLLLDQQADRDFAQVLLYGLQITIVSITDLIGGMNTAYVRRLLTESFPSKDCVCAWREFCDQPGAASRMKICCRPKQQGAGGERGKKVSQASVRVRNPQTSP